ncbi:MAG: hypothetical protein AAFX85_03675, partial [Pseudomonadota bacterium]
METSRQFGNEMDVTGTVKVSSAASVREAVRQILAQLYPLDDLTLLERAFDDFERIFRGEIAGYRGCKTVYHDMQHTLDMTLAMARLIGGHERHEA